MLTFFKEVIRQHYRILLLAVFIPFLWPRLKNQYDNAFVSSKTNSSIKMFTNEELAKYNGQIGSKGIYLAIMGSIFDVEKGKKHYGPGATYNFFVGKDASKSFVTGYVENETLDMDHVLSLEPNDILAVHDWKLFYEKEYIFKGKLIGRFYNDLGEETEYYHKIHEQIEIVREEIKRDEKLKSAFPPCNIEWKADSGTKVWCTNQSGGISRSWIGVPRKYFEPGNKNFRCACVHEDMLEQGNLKEYDNCDSNAVSCVYFIEDN